jgi:hypothetical protein
VERERERERERIRQIKPFVIDLRRKAIDKSKFRGVNAFKSWLELCYT